MVGKGTSGGECYGEYSGGTGSGGGYVNSCIHSGSNSGSSGNTVWYNYVAASAGTIKNSSSSDTAGTTITATESICPKNWTLPSMKQMLGNTNVSNFTPILGGTYVNGLLSNERSMGLWWSSEYEDNNATRYVLSHDSSALLMGVGRRRTGIYIRCVSEEKDVSDLTYMQDMTPKILLPHHPSRTLCHSECIKSLIL
ncbi:hypothetical protein IJG93_01610 [Candidatus Saccharibacteria bacterium]|nr:hypothetical protein [Candidatus Saccharibacteria bacterium]